LFSDVAWILSLGRLPRLCPHCRLEDPGAGELLAELNRRYGAVFPPSEDAQTVFYRADGCQDCFYKGRAEDLALFDVFRAGASPEAALEQASLIPLHTYAYRLAQRGMIALGDLLHYDDLQLRHVFSLLIANERILEQTTVAYEAKLAQLDAANRVLEGRTRSLFALHDMEHFLISSSDLAGLAARVCRRASEICGADRAILYFYWPGKDSIPEMVEVLAVGGWRADLVGRQLPKSVVFGASKGEEAIAFNRWPPGVPSPDQGQDIPHLRSGLYVPLIVENEQMGVMIVHSTEKDRFEPGETAMLRTFANQAALAIQRAGLIEQLRAKIIQLEAAQAELARKERFERELELARQVQQSVLPRDFPDVRGIRFAARNQPARQVGGDFYDVVSLDQDRIFIAIADVSGKGMPAALYMALARSLLRAEVRRLHSPDILVASVNQLLIELGQPDMFVTIFCGVLDCARRRLTYTRAGHDPPLLLRDGAVQTLNGRGMALGVMAGGGFSCSQEQLQLQAGDRLILYTDGLVDVIAPDGRLFGRERFKRLVRGCAELPFQELCASVFSELVTYQHGADQYDDMTMLVLGIETVPQDLADVKEALAERSLPEGEKR
jgi:serine phosphatase RsbU (regulator of sigma subunit)